MRNIVVYISGKYSGDIVANIDNARKLAIEVWEAGFTALTPHLNTIHFENDCQCVYDNFIAGDLELISRCDCLLMLPEWEKSKGALLEHHEANRLNKPIFYNLKSLMEYYYDRSRTS